MNYVFDQATGPAVTPTAQPQSSAFTDPAASESDYDALTDLFLADGCLAPATMPPPNGRPHINRTPQPKMSLPPLLDAPPTPTATPMTGQAEVEGIILGHLPVLASAWVAQYARYVADQHNTPVGLLRVQGGQTWIDMAYPMRGSPVPALSGHSHQDARAALQEARALTARWLVRVDEPSEGDLLGTPQLSAVTLLTGADDAAVVSSYRTMKSLCPITPEPDLHPGLRFAVSGRPATAEPRRPAFRLAIMGADDQKSAQAEAKLRRAALTFLDREVEPTVRVGKIGTCSLRPLFRGPASVSLNELLQIITVPRNLNGAPHAAVVSAPAVRSAPVGSWAAPEVIKFVKPVPSPAHVVAPKASTPVSAAALITGLVRLATTCPYAPLVELAAGTQGELHLLTSTPGTLGAVGVELGSAVQQLLTAAAWAQEHGSLLAAAFPALTPAPSSLGGPVLHILTTAAPPARGLIDTGIRLHLVSTVTVRDETARVCSDLN